MTVGTDTDTNARAFYLVDPATDQPTGAGKQEVVKLVTNSTAASAQTVYGGDYVVSAVASSWASGSAQLKYLGADGTTYINFGSALTANDTSGGTGIGLGSNATIVVAITGSPVGLYVTASRLP